MSGTGRCRFDACCQLVDATASARTAARARTGFQSPTCLTFPVAHRHPSYGALSPIKFSKGQRAHSMCGTAVRDWRYSGDDIIWPTADGGPPTGLCEGPGERRDRGKRNVAEWRGQGCKGPASRQWNPEG